MTPPAEDFGDLLARARGGDPAALGRLLDAHRTALARRAEYLLGGRIASRVDSGDVVQQTFLDAYTAFPRFAGATAPEFACWLVSTLDFNVGRLLRDHTRRQKRAAGRERPLAPPPGGPAGADAHAVAARLTTPSQRAMRAEDAERVLRALDALPADQREAVYLRHLEGRSLAEIAERMGRSLSATAGLIKRGMQALRDSLPVDPTDPTSR